MQGTYSSGDLDESREQNEGAKDVPTENANEIGRASCRERV